MSDWSSDVCSSDLLPFASGAWRKMRWLDLEGVDTAADDLRARGYEAGAVRFARGEGIHWGKGELYFTSTSGGAKKLGQIFRYVPSPKEGQAGEADEPETGRASCRERVCQYV